jgi:hypothetical protein
LFILNPRTQDWSWGVEIVPATLQRLQGFTGMTAPPQSPANADWENKNNSKATALSNRDMSIRDMAAPP